jgi:hypothetical protein
VLWLFSTLGSDVIEVTVTVLEYVTPDEPEGMWPVRVNDALAPAFIVASVQVTVPGLPGAGTAEQLKAGPLFWAIDTNVMLPGRVSEKLTLLAAPGPTFDITIVKGTLLLGKAVEGPLFVAKRSA